MLLPPTILACLPFGKPQRTRLGALLPLLADLRPGPRIAGPLRRPLSHTHGCQAARACDFTALNLAGLCEVVPYAHELAWIGDSTFIPKRGRRRGAGGLEPAVGSPVGPGPGRALLLSRPRSPTARVGTPFPPVGRSAAGGGDGDAGLAGRGPDRRAPPRHRHLRGRRPLRLRAHGREAGARGLVLFSQLRRDTALWVPWTGPPAQVRGVLRPRLHHAQLYYKPFKRPLRVVFVLDADPAAEAKPTTLFAADPEMAPAHIHRIHRDRFQIEFNFCDAKQAPGAGHPGGRGTPEPGQWPRHRAQRALHSHLERRALAPLHPNLL